MLTHPKPLRRRKVPRPLRRGTYLGAKRAKAKAAGTLTEQEWLRICLWAGFHCVYFGKHGGRLQQDHVVPIARGGTHTAGNCVPACEKHNSEKGTQTWEIPPGHPFRKAGR